MIGVLSALATIALAISLHYIVVACACQKCQTALHCLFVSVPFFLAVSSTLQNTARSLIENPLGR